jgi:hypothetical protein
VIAPALVAHQPIPGRSGGLGSGCHGLICWLGILAVQSVDHIPGRSVQIYDPLVVKGLDMGEDETFGSCQPTCVSLRVIAGVLRIWGSIGAEYFLGWHLTPPILRSHGRMCVIGKQGLERSSSRID